MKYLDDFKIAIPPFLAGGAKQLMIDGKWVDAQSGKTFESINPDTGQVLGLAAEGDAADIDLAVAAARRAFEGPWSHFTPAQRQAVILRLADLVDANFEELALLDSLEMGGPISNTRAYHDWAVGTLRFLAGQATAIHGETLPNSIADAIFTYTLKEPVGVVGAIIPWNGPTFGTTWKIAPILATGCTGVIKPSEETPFTALRIAELCLEAGVPPGVINVVTGHGHTAGAALAAHRDVDKVAFTGSTATGRKIVEASIGNLKRVTLELGGKSPDIVFADANLDEAVPGAAMAVFSNSGQICCAGTRLFVERSIYEEFTHRVAEFGKTLKVGQSLDPETQIGPLVSAKQLDRVTRYLAAGAREGARTLSGGARLVEGELANGFFVPPTVFTDVEDSMSIAREEIFGPVLSAIPFDDIEEVIRRSNATDFGLGSGVWTRDVGRAHAVAKAIRAGVVWVNCYSLFDPAVPFGGYKMSGYGREGGVDQMHEYLNTKSVWIKTS